MPGSPRDGGFATTGISGHGGIVVNYLAQTIDYFLAKANNTPIAAHKPRNTPGASDTALKLNEAAGGVSSTGVKQGVQAMGSIHRETTRRIVNTARG